MKKILVVEPHDYHYEVLPGVTYYFNRLGYSIVILVRNEKKVKDAFSRVPYFEKLKIVEYSDSLRDVLSKDNMAEYDFVFFNSLEYFHDNKKERVLDYLGFVPAARYGVLGIYHNLSSMSNKDLKLIEEGRVFTLSKCQYLGKDIKLLSASYYGETKDIKPNDNQGISIVIVGVSNERKKLEIAIGRKISLLKKQNVAIIYVGKRKPLRECVTRVVNSLLGRTSLRGWRYIKKYSDLPFQKLYAILDKSNYVAFIPDLEKGGSAFLNGKTSGTKQLSLGFIKPCILDERIAKAFELPEDCCVAYSSDFGEALDKILTLNEEQYQEIRCKLRKYKENVLEESENNLRLAIGNIMYQQ